MTLKKSALVLFLMLSLGSLSMAKVHAQSSNAGFVSGNIWYSADPFEEGDKIKIYTVIFNPDERELSGTVVFFDQSVFLGKKDFAVPAKGVKDLSIDWTATAGNHSIFAKIEDAKFLVSKGKYEEVYLAENETSRSTRTISKKIIPVADNTEKDPDSPATAGDKADSSGSKSVKEIGKMIDEKTPDFITSPIVAVAGSIDGSRAKAAVATDNKKIEVQAAINKLNADSEQDKTSEQKTKKADREENSNGLLKPFKYTELFALALASFSLNNKVIFYGALAIIIFLLGRYLWRLVF